MSEISITATYFTWLRVGLSHVKGLVCFRSVVEVGIVEHESNAITFFDSAPAHQTEV